VKIRPNRVKQQLAAGKVATIVAGTNEPDLIDQLGTLGVDGIWLEGEHGGRRLRRPGQPDARLRSVGRDLGGAGDGQRLRHDLPHPRSGRHGHRGAAREHARGGPVGGGVGEVRAARQARHVHEPAGLRVDEYLKTANDQSMLMVLIEDIVAVNNLDEILSVDNIDVFFVAPNDLATSMGHIGNMGHPEVQGTVDKAITKIVQSGPHRGHPRERGQRGALYTLGRARADDSVLSRGSRQAPRT
jgi:4-hydroxy-2-oxoheptanedioate aldolase